MSKEKKTSAAAAAGVPAAEKAANTPQKPADAKPTPPPAFSGIVIKEVRVRNYRCLRSVDVELDLLTVLIGQNNAGKTSFLNALFAAIGAGQRVISSDDVFLQKTEVSAPKDRMIAIDVLIRPTDDQGKIVDVFPRGSAWLELWGLGVVQDDEERDLVAIRTQFNAFLWEKGSIVDLNTLVSPNSPLYLYWAGFIDDRGEIGAFGALPNGDSHAVLLVPCDENEANTEGCEGHTEGGTEVQGETNQRPNVVLPKNVRMMLQRRMGRIYHLPGFGVPRD